MEKEVIFTYSLLQKLNKPGLWFVCSEHPASELKQYVYDFAVESGLPIVVYSDIPRRIRIFPWLTSTDPHDCISKGKTSHPYILQTL